MEGHADRLPELLGVNHDIGLPRGSPGASTWCKVHSSLIIIDRTSYVWTPIRMGF